jgi:hypothetical protein
MTLGQYTQKGGATGFDLDALLGPRNMAHSRTQWR